MSQSDRNTTVQDLKDLVISFRSERGWEKYHNPQNLAMAICVEAAELLEHFQWEGLDKQDKSELAKELADVLIYCFNFADTLDIDIASAFTAKLEQAAVKFPTAVFNPERKDDIIDDYMAARKAYKRKKDQQ